MKPCFSIFILAFLLISCSGKNKQEQRLLQVLEQEKNIQCKLASMKDSIGREWDAINAMLEKNLPPTMPAAEKHNMLQVRNANLIRMFKSYDGVSEDVKLALSEVESKDLKMSERINALKKESQAIESQKIILYEEIVQKEGEQALAAYKKNYTAAAKSNCN